MKPFSLVRLALLFSSLAGFLAGAEAPASAAKATPNATVAGAKSAAPAVTDELNQLIARINAKLKAGVGDPSALTEDLAAFDRLLAAHKNEKTEAVAQIPYIKAMLYIQVFKDYEEGAKVLTQLKADFPTAPQARDVDAMLAELAPGRETQKIQQALKPGFPFPDFAEKDLAGEPLSIGKFKGKVVLVDFWATWCGPCVQELPTVLAAYQKFHPKGFEIVGISLDEKEFTLKSFLKSTGMTWPQYFDGKGWQSKLGQKYGIGSIPATFLLDRDGKIVARDLRGPALEAQLAKLLGP